MVFLGSTPIGGPIVGWISDAAGPRVGLLVGAASCAVAALYCSRAMASGPLRAPEASVVAVAD
jgi:hypothetical protein